MQHKNFLLIVPVAWRGWTWVWAPCGCGPWSARTGFASCRRTWTRRSADPPCTPDWENTYILCDGRKYVCIQTILLTVIPSLGIGHLEKCHYKQLAAYCVTVTDRVRKSIILHPGTRIWYSTQVFHYDYQYRFSQLSLYSKPWRPLEVWSIRLLWKILTL